MGTDDLFKKRRAKKKACEAGNIEPKADSYLIVCEGEKTETCARIQCRMGSLVRQRMDTGNNLRFVKPNCKS